MAIGLNAVREICARCPLAMGEDLLRDLAMCKGYKEKSVMMAAGSLIMIYREQLPNLLHKKDRGRPTEAQAEIKKKNYGEVIAYDTVPGAEVLLQTAKSVDVGSDNEDGGDDDDDEDDGEMEEPEAEEKEEGKSKTSIESNEAESNVKKSWMKNKQLRN